MDGVNTPGDAVLATAGKEWERRAQEGEPWREFSFSVPEGSFAVTITTTSPSIVSVSAAAAAAAFIEKVGAA